MKKIFVFIASKIGEEVKNSSKRYIGKLLSQKTEEVVFIGNGISEITESDWKTVLEEFIASRRKTELGKEGEMAILELDNTKLNSDLGDISIEGLNLKRASDHILAMRANHYKIDVDGVGMSSESFTTLRHGYYDEEGEGQKYVTTTVIDPFGKIGHAIPPLGMTDFIDHVE